MRKVSKHVATVNISNNGIYVKTLIYHSSHRSSLTTNKKGATKINNAMLGPVRTTMCWTGVGVMDRLHWQFLLRFQVRFPRVIYWRFRGDTLHAAKSRLKLQKKLPV